MLRFGLCFASIILVLFAAELTPVGQALIVLPWTSALASAATGLMAAFDPGVTASGATIYSNASGFAVTILPGCSGLEGTIVLVAAILAYPAPWVYRLAGIVSGILAIQLLNLVRVVSLFYIGQWNAKVFEWAHLYAWQVLIMLDAIIVWLLWLRTLPRHSRSSAT
ncbi:MAG TPA: exosortase H [Usitatibacter sp.]|nr:exosortase H [Usitatibacter sp.]